MREMALNGCADALISFSLDDFDATRATDAARRSAWLRAMIHAKTHEKLFA